MADRWTGELSALEAEVLRDGRIDAEDVLRLRRTIYQNGGIEREEAELLFHLNHHSRGNDRAWDEFFVEALSDFFYWREGSDSRLSPEAEQFLLDAISADGEVHDATELRLLLKLIFRTNHASERFRNFVLNAVRHSVLHSDRAMFDHADRQPGVIDRADVEVIRRLIYGMGSENAFAISRTEAEFLFELNEATAGQANDPSWRDLFVKAITAYLLLGGDTPEQVDEPEARWLIARIEACKKPCDNERALLAYLKQEARPVHPLLHPLCERLGV